jgi:hypothetical protein
MHETERPDTIGRRPRARVAYSAEALEPRVLLAFAPAGPEFRVNSQTQSEQAAPAIAADGDGDFVVVWEDRSVEAPDYGIRAQRYDAAGNVRGVEFSVNTFTANDQRNPDVATDADGDFVVAWQTEIQDGSEYGVYAQRFNAAGAPQGIEFRVNTHTAGTQILPAVAMDASGDFVVTWVGAGPEPGLNVYARRYDAAGNVLGNQFLVNAAAPAFNRLFPAAAMDADGDFVIAWHSYGQDTDGDGVYARRYNAAGQAQGAEFLVNVTTASSQANAAVAMDASGDFVVAWESFRQDAPAGYGIYARRYSAAGAAQSGEIPVNQTPAGQQRHPAVTIEPDGDFVVAWSGNGPGDDYGAFARRYTAAGAPQGNEFLINNTTFNSQGAVAAAADDEGDLVFAWASFGQDGSGFGVYARRYDESVDAGAPVVADAFVGTRRVVAGGALIGPMARVVVSFSESISTAGGAGGANSVTNPANWVLTRDGADVSSGIASIAFALNASANRYEAALNLATSYPDGNFVLRATPNLRDVAGNALDGDFDGAAGGTFVLPFRITPALPNAPGGALVNNPDADTTTQDTQSGAAVLALGDGGVLVAFNDSGSLAPNPGHVIGYARSTNGGDSFTDLGRLPDSQSGDGGSPVLARDNATGRVYLATVPATSTSIQVSRSDDGGRTFQAPVRAFSGAVNSDRPWITVDNFGGAGNGNVYVAARNFAAPQGIFLARSDNGVAGFVPSTTVPLWTTGRGPHVVVGPDHGIYVFSYQPPQAGQPATIQMRRSVNFGASFEPAVTVATLGTSGLIGDLGLEFNTNSFPQVVVNPVNGHLYCVFADNPAGPDRGDVYFTMSTSSGTTWSAPQRVNGDATTNDQFFPTIAVRPDGSKLFVGWHDRRNDPDNRLIATHGAIGTVGGSAVSFGGNFRISPLFAPVFGVDSSINPRYMGEYDVAAADDSFFYFAWGDNRDDSRARPGKQANVRLARIPESGPPAPPPQPAAVTSHAPAGSIVVTAPVYVDFTFDLPINPDSFTLEDDVVGFTGPGNADLRGSLTGVSWVNASTLRVSFNPRGAEGAYTMVIGPEIRTLVDNQPMDQDRDGSAGEAAQDRYTASFDFAPTVGPDGFGYVAVAAAPPTSADLVAGDPGVVTLINNIDDSFAAVPLGTNTFNFYGTTYTGDTQLFANTNGLITFGAGSAALDNTDLTTVAANVTPRAIAVLWDDWQTDAGTVPTDSAVLYRLDAANNQLVIEWSDVPHFVSGGGRSGPVTFRAALQLNTGAAPGTIRLEYPGVTAGNALFDNGVSATIGVRDGGTQGPRRLLVSFNAAGAIHDGSAILITTNPLATAGEFVFRSGPPHRLRFTFNQDVSASLAAADLSVVRLGPGGGPVASPAPSYDGATNVATFAFGGTGVLPDGNYRATLSAAGVTNAAGAAMPADFVLEFFVLAGDVNRDRSVNGTDFAILAGNFGKTGQTFATGDVNGDGSVNGTDFAILAGNFGRTVPPPAVALADGAALAGAAAAATRADATRVTSAPSVASVPRKRAEVKRLKRGATDALRGGPRSRIRAHDLG